MDFNPRSRELNRCGMLLKSGAPVIVDYEIARALNFEELTNPLPAMKTSLSIPTPSLGEKAF